MLKSYSVKLHHEKKKHLKCREYVLVALLQNKDFYALFQS